MWHRRAAQLRRGAEDDLEPDGRARDLTVLGDDGELAAVVEDRDVESAVGELDGRRRGRVAAVAQDARAARQQHREQGEGEGNDDRTHRAAAES